MTPRRDSRRHRSLNGPSRETDLRRRAGFREERPAIRLVVEGRTEKLYFESIPVPRGQAERIKAQELGRDALQIVRRAKDLACDEYDVWCVVDVDGKDLSEPLLEARRSGITVAVSNPCFEVWLLLHHEDRTAPFQSAGEVERALKKALPGWSKSKTRFADFAAGVAEACSRARRLDPTGERHDLNPSTSVWRVVERIKHPR